MAITRIQSNASSFIQPLLGAVVNVVSDPGIEWIKVGSTVYIRNGGVYEVMSISIFVYSMKLITAEALTGTVVVSEMIIPVNATEEPDYNWGGIKEW